MKKIILIAILLCGSLSFANGVVATLSCTGVDDSSLWAGGNIWGVKESDGISFQFLDLELQYNKKVIQQWPQVPFVNRGFSFSARFANGDVLFEALYDDVGAMSELKFGDQDVRLTCSFY